MENNIIDCFYEEVELPVACFINELSIDNSNRYNLHNSIKNIDDDVLVSTLIDLKNLGFNYLNFESNWFYNYDLFKIFSKAGFLKIHKFAYSRLNSDGYLPADLLYKLRKYHIDVVLDIGKLSEENFQFVKRKIRHLLKDDSIFIKADFYKYSFKDIDLFLNNLPFSHIKNFIIEPMFDLHPSSKSNKIYPNNFLRLNDCSKVWRSINKKKKLIGNINLSFSYHIKSTHLLREHPCNAYMCAGKDCHAHKSGFPRRLFFMQDGSVLPESPLIHSCKIGNLNDVGIKDLLRDYFNTSQYKKFKKICRVVFNKYVINFPHPIIPWVNILVECNNKLV